jgi:two-component system sensor histidine kinase PilS (NtrC family)
LQYWSPVRIFQPQNDSQLLAVLTPRRLVRRVYLGRVSLASAIFLAAVFQWLIADSEKTLVATLCFVGALFVTSLSFLWTEVNRKPLTRGFLYTQLVIDLLVITAVVHVTGGAASQFAALYILANAAAALLLPGGGAVLIALLGSVLYAADALVVTRGPMELTLILQLIVFSAVAIGTGVISWRLQEAGEGRAALAAELATVRLREKDILANIRSGIITVDEEGALLFANAAASELLRLDLSQLRGRAAFDAIGARVPAFAALLRSGIASGLGVTRAEFELVDGGRALPLGLTMTGASIGAESRRTYTAIFQDISDQKRLEQLNLRAQRLEAVAELAASLAHEIKNPLASIQSAVEQLSARAGATADERTLGTLVLRESERLSRLLSEFLDFARVRVARREPVDIAAVVRAACAVALEHPSRARGVTLELRLSECPLELRGDADLLHRAVFNLVLNALQAARPDSAVSVSATIATAEQIPRGVQFPAGAVCIAIVDAGPGIAPEVQDRLFEPFATTKVGGTGLGLSITHRAVEAHRGVVLVDSSSNGTRFTILLPVEPAAAQLAAAPISA